MVVRMSGDRDIFSPQKINGLSQRTARVMSLILKATSRQRIGYQCRQCHAAGSVWRQFIVATATINAASRIYLRYRYMEVTTRYTLNEFSKSLRQDFTSSDSTLGNITQDRCPWCFFTYSFHISGAAFAAADQPPSVAPYAGQSAAWLFRAQSGHRHYRAPR